MKYTLDEIPFEQYPIFHKTDIVAFICLENIITLETYPDIYKKRLHNSICVGLLLGNAKESKYSFVISLCKTLVKTVNEAAELLSTQSEKVTLDAGDLLTEVLDVINNAIDYTNIDAEKISLKTDTVQVTKFVKDIMSYIPFSQKINVDFDGNIPDSLIFDKNRVQQILETVFTKVADIPDLRLNVRLDNYSTFQKEQYFLLITIGSRSGTDIRERFATDRFTMNNLGIFLVKRLCEIMNGTMIINDYGMSIKISVDIPGKTDVAKGKHIIIGTNDMKLYRDISGMLDKLKAFPSILTDTTVLTEGLAKYDLVILDETYAAYALLVAKQGVPVIGTNLKADNSAKRNFDVILPTNYSTDSLNNALDKLLAPLTFKEIIHKRVAGVTRNPVFYTKLVGAIQELGDSSTGCTVG